MTRVLIGCEFSGVVRRAFRALGHEAWSCDLLPAEDGGEHIQGDVLEVAQWGCWDLAIFHPPCTYLANSGVRWLYEKDGDGTNVPSPERWQEMELGAAFFRELMEAPIPMIAVENPIPHKYAVERIGRRYDQLIQPYWFGHNESKATCLWLKGLPPLEPTDIVDGREGRVWKESPGADRWKRRSRTYEGIAKALAEQYGSLGHNARDEKG